MPSTVLTLNYLDLLMGQCCCLVAKSCPTPLATPLTVAHQLPLPMRFLRQKYWSGLSLPPPGDLPNPGVEPMSLALAGGFFTAEPPGKPSGMVW